MCSPGDAQQEFTIQSICKPFAFQMALEEFGRDRTLKELASHLGLHAFEFTNVGSNFMQRLGS